MVKMSLWNTTLERIGTETLVHDWELKSCIGDLWLTLTTLFPQDYVKSVIAIGAYDADEACGADWSMSWSVVERHVTVTACAQLISMITLVFVIIDHDKSLR